ncbi:MAG: attachment invasion locus protein [Psychromonas sp.]|jgi:attachment invasion locus protein|uniref:porin family protein n=1 Tax=Psychromonas sp. TaxID=1884585 RepID=UPI0039E5B525
MKNLLFGTSLLLALFSANSMAANDFSGSRLGLGLSKTSVSDGYYEYRSEDYDYGDGFKFEYGYDFNQIVGLGVSYETNNDDNFFNGELEGRAIKVGADIGYAFPIQDVFLKPYGKIGFVSYSEDFSIGSDSSEFDDSSIFAGLGVRFQYSHFYTDLSMDFYTLENIDFVQTALTAGYKF